MLGDLREKYDALQKQLVQLGSAAVAFSAGVDSQLLLAVAHDVLGSDVLACTARLHSQSPQDICEAQEFCNSRGVQQVVFDLGELDVPGFADNPPERCYLCKRQMYRSVRAIADARGIGRVLDGTNADDLHADRPGLRSLREQGVICPLAACGFTKQDVRDLARELELPSWDKPSESCLYTRLAFGEAITPEKLALVRSIEDALRPQSFKHVRARLSGSSLNVEIEL